MDECLLAFVRSQRQSGAGSGQGLRLDEAALEATRAPEDVLYAFGSKTEPRPRRDDDDAAAEPEVAPSETYAVFAVWIRRSCEAGGAAAAAAEDAGDGGQGSCTLARPLSLPERCAVGCAAHGTTADRGR